MVDKNDMLAKPPGPGAAKRFLDQVVFPLAIDAAGSGEVAIQSLSRRSGIRPAVLVGGLAGGAVLLFALAATRRRRNPAGIDGRTARPLV